MGRTSVVLVLTSLLAALMSCGEADIHTLVIRDDGETRKQTSYFERGEYLGLRIPAIGLETRLNYAPLVDGSIDRGALKSHPAWICPEAGPGLCEIGRSGVSLILGHRQWGMRPLVFARLDELRRGDTLTIFGRALSLSYEVFDRAEIHPDNIWRVVEGVSGLALREARSVIILVTCAPYGQNHRRLLVFAHKRGGG
ncbi:MAG: sortase [Patescibacteria group bacterium]